MSCPRCVKWIDELFLGRISPWKWQRLIEHLRTCPPCARYYDRAALAFRTLSPEPGDLTAEELAAIGATAVERAAPRRAALRRWWAVGGGLVAACAAAIFLFVVSPPGPDPGEVTARGVAPPAFDFGIRAYCLSDAAGLPRVVAVSSDETGHLTCGSKDLLQFAYTLREARAAYLFVAGIDDGGQRHEYYPRPPAASSAEIRPTQREEPLPGSIRLGVKHRAGATVRVTALVSRSPLSHEQAVLLSSAAPEGDAEAQVRRLEISLEVVP
ncbi:MAG: anti-sigma factor [Myxococcaceae bacterium]